eukprot:TRINITY_DN7298_c0_g1_i2.p1 TRINITY_DN7298_c0_g1~~TRINITY_DN7298_c0_g1_i2.p1  ORF type:complete len:181 (-),score=36.72 TRINITY_DN7298_c0_g1_i2:52-594(-)
MLECLNHEKAIAFGEIGLDYHRNVSEPEVQQQVFARQLQLAVQINKPILIHSRDAPEDTWRILKQHAPTDWPIHIHCFSDDAATAERLLADFSRLYIGITGSVSFTSARTLREAVKRAIPLDRLLLETDAPYMPPNGANTKICHSGHIPLIAAAIAELKECSLEDVLIAARENTRAVYGI